jgi:hypothetical protein
MAWFDQWLLGINHPEYGISRDVVAER